MGTPLSGWRRLIRRPRKGCFTEAEVDQVVEAAVKSAVAKAVAEATKRTTHFFNLLELLALVPKFDLEELAALVEDLNQDWSMVVGQSLELSAQLERARKIGQDELAWIKIRDPLQLADNGRRAVEDLGDLGLIVEAYHECVEVIRNAKEPTALRKALHLVGQDLGWYEQQLTDRLSEYVAKLVQDSEIVMALQVLQDLRFAKYDIEVPAGFNAVYVKLVPASERLADDFCGLPWVVEEGRIDHVELHRQAVQLIRMTSSQAWREAAVMVAWLQCVAAEGGECATDLIGASRLAQLAELAEKAFAATPLGEQPRDSQADLPLMPAPVSA